MITKEQKEGLIEEYRHHDSDTGAPEVQIAILSNRIGYLTDSGLKSKRRPHFQLAESFVQNYGVDNKKGIPLPEKDHATTEEY